jgi:hypothetical protein
VGSFVGYLGSKVQRFKGSKVQRFKVSKVQRYRVTGVQSFKVSASFCLQTYSSKHGRFLKAV